jgi:hypothetical protein
MNPQSSDSESKRGDKVSDGSRVLFVFATGVLILWFSYRTFVMVSDAIARGEGIAPIVGGVIGGTIFDLRTMGLFIGVFLLGRKLKKQSK